jgi:hypothetical protein
MLRPPFSSGWIMWKHFAATVGKLPKSNPRTIVLTLCSSRCGRAPSSLSLLLSSAACRIASFFSAPLPLSRAPALCPAALKSQPSSALSELWAAGAYPPASLPYLKRAVGPLFCSVTCIHDPGTLDGGDVLKVGKTVYVGSGSRSNAEGGAPPTCLLFPVTPVCRHRPASRRN